MNNGAVERDVTRKCAQNLQNDAYTSRLSERVGAAKPRTTIPKYFSSPARKQHDNQSVDLSTALSIKRTNSMAVMGLGQTKIKNSYQNISQKLAKGSVISKSNSTSSLRLMASVNIKSRPTEQKWEKETFPLYCHVIS